MGRAKNRATELEATREALASWRQQYGGRGRPIPESLWSEAAQLARSHGVAATARALRLDAKRLDTLVGAGAEIAIARRGAVEPRAFVELGGIDIGGGRNAVVVELVGREGDRVRVEVAGGAGSVTELVQLARAFWSRGT